ncbi:alpha-1,4-glucan--maltose-1-phosphate maltosyltransferase [Nocardioides sp. BYT-33-1]|uniref:alpha-1,4-glucan--maltose-1-phosphate maltosyltransferase n=1 Tax=Nocardioides sp. BYT-33-1 TaxID=3416952 RepID=UPI003F52CD6B
MVGRIPVIDVEPVLAAGTSHPAPGGRLPVKASLNEPFPVSATVFREGHDRLGAEVVLIGPDGVRRPPVRMRALPARDRFTVDRHEAWVRADAEGAWSFEVHAWSDPIATWEHAAGIKIRAGVDVELMFAEGRLLLERVLGAGGLTKAEQATVRAAITAADDTTRPVEARLAQLESPELRALLDAHPLRDLLTVEGPFPVFVDRSRALFGSWYELFPRSEGATHDPATGEVVSGTFRTAAERLPAVAAMGFDVVYLPPIHPIGEVNRKGPNNTVLPEGEPTPADWKGSPWAIGSKDGGHDAVHPDLGTIEDFGAFVAAARALDLEVALDLALQCAPDHPWVAAHPEWFTTRADGSIAYAENPPKKYQDIYPVNFDNDPAGISAEVLRVVRHWMDHGVRIFRVDNPHTKPVAFWQWLLAEVRRTDPDVLFLAEAFTKPPMLQTLGAIGFHQSYTYFTWRTEKVDVEDYLREVAHESAHRIRPNFFVNTPDILHEFLQYGGPGAFRIRAVLASMSSPSWGMYAGYELGEHVAVRPGSEEYLDSEKYQIRVRDWSAATSGATNGHGLASYITRLNAIRRAHPALQLLRNLRLHAAEDDHVICWSKSVALPDGTSDRVVVVLSLDPHQVRESMVHLDLAALGLAPGTSFTVHDELTGSTWTWGEHNYVRLDPAQPAHILSVKGPA